MRRTRQFNDTEFFTGFGFSSLFPMHRFSAETEIGIRAASFTAAYPKR
jgi:hypothetical protein